MSQTAAGDAVRLENVSFRYPGSRQGVHDIDLAIATGELLVCVGPSGCGKTTLLRLIAGFVAPDAGRVLLAGADQAGLGPRTRGCGIVFQSYALFPTMRVWENVAYPLRVRGVAPAERRARAQSMLELTGLAAHADRLPAGLSGGQQQRVALARALVFEPKALLLDEPLSALDATTRMLMRDEIRRIQRLRGIATLLITHDQDEALSMGDRVAVLREGRIEQVAAPRTLYDTPATGFVAGFVGRANLLEAVVRSATTVQTALGLIEVLPHPVEAGVRVRLLIRPERIQPLAALAAAGPAVANLFAAQVTRDRFHGSIRQVDLDARPATGHETGHSTGQPAAATTGVPENPPQIHPLRLETASRDDIRWIRIPPESVQFLPTD